MADMNRAEMITFSLQYMQVLGRGSTVNAADSKILGSILDSVHGQLSKKKLVQFPTSAFPSWAQEPFAMIMEEAAGKFFGIRAPGMRKMGEKELVIQMEANRPPGPIEAVYF